MTSLDTDDAFFPGVIIQFNASPAGFSFWKWHLRLFDAWKILKPGVRRMNILYGLEWRNIISSFQA